MITNGTSNKYNSCLFKVPRVGIEPTLPKELDFESSASTSSATEAGEIILCRPQK